MSTNSGLLISKLELDAFPSGDRKLYVTLALELMKEPLIALEIMAMLIWMEGNRYIDTVEKISNLPIDVVNGLAEEAIVCINFLKNDVIPTPSQLYNSIPLLHFLMKKELSHLFCGGDRSSAVDGIEKIYKDVCLTTLGDLRDRAESVHKAAKRGLIDQQISQINRSFSSSVGLGAAADLSSHGAGTSSSGGHRSSSLLQAGTHVSSPSSGLRNPGLGGGGGAADDGFGLGFGLDPIKVVVPGRPVAPHGYVGMGRRSGSGSGSGSSFTNRALDPPCSPVRSKPNVGVIGPPPRRATTTRSFDLVPAAPKMNHHAPNHRTSHYYLPMNPPAMGAGPSMLMPPIPPHHFPVPLPPEQRTLFVTFSKGYRVNEYELREFITLCFGNCIETLSMQETHGDEQPLYARVVFYRPETTNIVLNGEEKAKFTINGKHVWARKFVPRNPRSFFHL
uniref:RRM domain-containing protein n=1 Tax=Kalanchoe fedtschenkoi TaxID=63787 RepID=A0A7N0UVD9_KALFE